MKEIPRSRQLEVPYHKVLWYNCNQCKTHYTSYAPLLRANLCDECWKSMPHYRTTKIIKRKQPRWKKVENWLQEMDNTIFGAMLYILGCSISLLIVGYYLWVK